MMHRVPTAHESLRRAEEVLKESSLVEHPHRGKEMVDAEELLEFVLGHAADQDEEISAQEERRFRRLVSRRAQGVPSAYLIGWTDFRGLRMQVRRGAFIPRQSSEFMVEQVLARLRARKDPVHVDLATGVGPVALAVAHGLPRATVFGVDLYRRPIAVARENAGKLGLGNVSFLRGDLFGPLPPDLRGRVDTISVHPPYVARREMRELPHEIAAFEPRESLTDESRDGMGLLRRTVGEAPAWLRARGWLLVEVSPDRSRVVATQLRRGGFRNVRSTKGGVAVTRIVVGRR